jgi:hypothetical protein
MCSVSRRVAVIVLITLLAGCGSILGTPEATETVTPAAVPEVSETPTAGEGPLPPGLTGGGVRDSAALATAHLDAVRGRSYTWRSQRLFGATQNDRTLRVAAPRRYSYRQTSPGAEANTTEFADGEVVYTRYYRFVERLRRAPAPNATDQYGPMAAGAIERYLAVESATVAETLVDGDRYYRVRASTDRYRPIDAAVNYSVTALIAPDGFVRSLHATYEIDGENRTVAVEHRFRYTDIGTTTVTEPQWLRNDTWPENGSR